ncbi:TPA: hypothetical protein ACKRF0_000149 [Proteus mirabilis]
MTMIAGLKINGYSFLISDTLITGHNDGKTKENNSAIPTLGDTSNFITNDNYNVLGLLSKIEIINNYFVISWAGNVFAAKAIINQLIIKFNRKVPTHQEIVDCIDKSEHVHFIWIIKNTSGMELRSYNAAKNSNHKYFDESIVAGSSDTTIEEADEFFQNKSKSISLEDIVADSACTALFMFSHLMNHEMLMKDKANTLHDKFGGYYDLVLFYDDKFQRLNSVTFIYLDATTDASGYIQIEGSGSIIKQSLHERKLIVNKINFEATDTFNKNKLYSKINYNQSFPIHSTFKHPECIEHHDFSSQFVCIMTRCDSSLGHHCLIRKYETSRIAERETIEITRKNKKLILKFNQNFFKIFEKELMSFYNGKQNNG